MLFRFITAPSTLTLLFVLANVLLSPTGNANIVNTAPENAEPADEHKWVVAFDNDFLVPGSRDQDYTYGFSARYCNNSLAGKFLAEPLDWLDSRVGFKAPATHSVEIGLYGFTPENIKMSEANPNDRPYASLIYGASHTQRAYPLANKVIRTQLTLGVLGLDLVGDLQKSLHSIIDSKDPAGWHHQISQGGELTARYSVAQQKRIGLSSELIEVKQTQSLSLGYITEATWGMTFRTGSAQSSWQNFNPDLVSYAETSAQVNEQKNEHFLWWGFAVKARAYNAFLQGQFKHSDVSYSFEELEHLITEAWVGYTQSFKNGVFLSYSVRGHTSEIRQGDGDRNVVWGGLTLGQNL